LRSASECKVDHHDGVLLDDADEQNQSNERDDGEVGAGKEKEQ